MICYVLVHSRIHPPAHFKQKFAVNEVYYTDEVHTHRHTCTHTHTRVCVCVCVCVLHPQIAKVLKDKNPSMLLTLVSTENQSCDSHMTPLLPPLIARSEH